MELSIDNKLSVGKNNETAILLVDLLTYQMPAEWIRLIRWLQVATSKDIARPVLHAFHVQGTRIETTDGFRIHMIEFETPEARLLPEGLLELVSISKRNVIFRDVSDSRGKFPETDSIFANMKPLNALIPTDNEGRQLYHDGSLENVTAFVYVSPDLLASSLNLRDTQGTKITIHNGPVLIEFPVRWGGYEDIGVRSIKAILMPVFTSDGKWSGLTPHQAGGWCCV